MPSDKVFSSADAAVADIPDGAVVMVGGYAVPGTPQGLVRALLRQAARGLTCISGPWYVNDPELHDVARLVAAGRVRKVITATPIRSSPIAAAAPMDRRRSGELEVEMVAQATLAERIRAGGAGLGGVFLPAHGGDAIDPTKEKRVIDGVPCSLEVSLQADFALLRAHTADTLGNLVYRRTQRNWNPVMATAVAVTIVEVDEIVEPGDLDPELVITPAIYIDRIVRAGGGPDE